MPSFWQEIRCLFALIQSHIELARICDEATMDEDDQPMDVGTGADARSLVTLPPFHTIAQSSFSYSHAWQGQPPDPDVLRPVSFTNLPAIQLETHPPNPPPPPHLARGSPFSAQHRLLASPDGVTEGEEMNVDGADSSRALVLRKMRAPSQGVSAGHAEPIGRLIITYRTPAFQARADGYRNAHNRARAGKPSSRV